MNIILLAADFARQAHEGQVRKYTGLPYITHPARVAGRAMVHPMASEEFVAAAFLHDVPEETPDADISEFGPKIVTLTLELYNPSKGSKAPRPERKQQDRDHLAKISNEGKALKLLDRVDNLTDLLSSAKHTISAEVADFYRIYADESELLAEVIGDVDPALKAELLQLIYDIRILRWVRPLVP